MLRILVGAAAVALTQYAYAIRPAVPAAISNTQDVGSVGYVVVSAAQLSMRKSVDGIPPIRMVTTAPLRPVLNRAERARCRSTLQ